MSTPDIHPLDGRPRPLPVHDPPAAFSAGLDGGGLPMVVAVLPYEELKRLDHPLATWARVPLGRFGYVPSSVASDDSRFVNPVTPSPASEQERRR